MGIRAMDQVQSDILRDSMNKEAGLQESHKFGAINPHLEVHSGVHAWCQLDWFVSFSHDMDRVDCMKYSHEFNWLAGPIATWSAHTFLNIVDQTLIAVVDLGGLGRRRVRALCQQSYRRRAPLRH